MNSEVRRRVLARVFSLGEFQVAGFLIAKVGAEVDPISLAITRALYAS